MYSYHDSDTISMVDIVGRLSIAVIDGLTQPILHKQIQRSAGVLDEHSKVSFEVALLVRLRLRKWREEHTQDEECSKWNFEANN